MKLPAAANLITSADEFGRTPLHLAAFIAAAIAVLVLVSLAVQSTLGTGSVIENIGGTGDYWEIVPAW